MRIRLSSAHAARAVSSLSLLVAFAAACNQSAMTAPSSSATAETALPQTAPTPAPAAANVAPSEDESEGQEQGNEGDESTLPAAPKEAVADNSPRAFLAEVDRELGHMRESTYVHRTSIDETTGTFDYDCSGFVGYALEGSAPSAFEELRAATVKRPLAKHFETFFSSLPSGSAAHWAHVARVSDLQPGDIVAWLRPPDVSSKNTGHVVTVHGAVTPEEGHPGSFLVPIADSTSMRHGRGDSRLATKATGLGAGTLVLVADASGAPVGYRWSLSKKAHEHACTIAMARLSAR